MLFSATAVPLGCIPHLAHHRVDEAQISRRSDQRDVAATGVPGRIGKIMQNTSTLANHDTAIGFGLELRRHPVACGGGTDLVNAMKLFQ